MKLLLQFEKLLEEFTIKQLADLILELSNSKSKIIQKELPEDDPKQRQPDISLVKEMCGWEPKVQLEEGLLKTIKYFDEIMQIQ